MDSKTLAETQRICDAGLGAYLSQKHSDFRLRNFSKGVVVGSIFSVVTYGLLTFGFDMKSQATSYALLPLGAGLLGGEYRGLTQAESEDSVHTADFDEVCASLESTEDEESEAEDSE